MFGAEGSAIITSSDWPMNIQFGQRRRKQSHVNKCIRSGVTRVDVHQQIISVQQPGQHTRLEHRETSHDETWSQTFNIDIISTFIFLYFLFVLVLWVCVFVCVCLIIRVWLDYYVFMFVRDSECMVNITGSDSLGGDQKQTLPSGRTNPPQRRSSILRHLNGYQKNQPRSLHVDD